MGIFTPAGFVCYRSNLAVIAFLPTSRYISSELEIFENLALFKKESHMKDLQDNPECDIYIQEELEKAGINLVRRPRPTDGRGVASTISGQLGRFTFERARIRWVATGMMPMAAAREMYADPNGRFDVRVDGHGSAPSPEGRGEWYDPKTHRRIYDMNQKAEFEKYANSKSTLLRKSSENGLRDNDFAEDPSAVGEGFIPLYHIDSQEGLNLFAATIRAYKLF